MSFHKDWLEDYEKKELLFTNFLKFYLTKEYDLNESIIIKLISTHSTLKGILENLPNIKELKNAEGKKLFRIQQKTIDKLKTAFESLDKTKSIEELYYNSIGRFFIKRQIINIEDLKLETITPNPFLIRSMNITKVGELIEFIVQSRITRSIVTSFGYVFEDILVALSYNKYF